MVQQVTKGIKVSVETRFEGTYAGEFQSQYAFAYTISIENQSKDTVQLVSRFWKISDSLNHTEVVNGEGVIGEKPILEPGAKHVYSSGCVLLSPFGSMKGHYTMYRINTAGKFKVGIPSFRLSAPFAMN